jgi:hypothetical protein
MGLEIKPFNKYVANKVINKATCRQSQAFA